MQQYYHSKIMRIRLFSVMVFALFLLTGCRKQPDYPTVSLNVAPSDSVVAADLASGKLPLRVAVAAVISPKATFDAYHPLLDYLAKHLNRPVELLLRPTYTEINELLRTGQADIAFVCGGAFVEGEREQYMELLVLPEINGTTTYQAYIITRSQSSIQNFSDLRGKSFAFSDPLSNSGRLYVQYRLFQMGETPESYFGNAMYTYSHDNSIRAVAEGIVDAASVDSLVFDALMRQEPELNNLVRVIERSPYFGIPPVVVHPDLDRELKTAVQQVFLMMDQNTQGQQALASLYIDRFVETDVSNYTTIRQMAATIRHWSQP